MQCHEIHELLSSYHDGELPSEVAETVRRHLETCPTCSAELAALRNIGSLFQRTPIPAAADNWSAIEAEVRQRASAAAKPGWRLFPALWPRLALAASVLVAIALGLASLRSNPAHAATVNLDRFVTEFPRDPDGAEKVLLASYQGERVDPKAVNARISFASRLASPPPAEYTLKSTYLLKMPCCHCVQAIYSRADGSMLCVFEHAGEQPMDFGNRPSIQANCAGRNAQLIQVNDCLAAAWNADQTRMTVVGARDVGEVVRLVRHFGDSAGERF